MHIPAWNGLSCWRFRAARRRPARLAQVVLLALAVSIGAVHLYPAHAADAAERARELAQQAAERAREQAQQAAERAREQAQQAAERAREQAQQAAERAREQAQKAAERPKAEVRQPETESKGDEKEANGATAEKSARKQAGKESGKGLDDEDDGPPATVVELVRRLTTPRKGRPAPLNLPQTSHSNTEVLAVGLTQAGLAKARALGFTIGRSSNLRRLHMRVTRMTAPPGFDAVRARDLLRSEARDERLALNYVYRPYRSAASDQGEPNVRVPGMRKATLGGCDMARCYAPAVMEWGPRSRACAQHIRIGIIDTSVDMAHPTFKGRNVQIGNFLPSGTARTVNWHGTGILAVLGGDLNSGTPGLIPDADFLVADVYHADKDGRPLADTVSLISALDWMGSEDVKIINMSMSGSHDALLQKAIADLSARGVLFVAAAGNEGPAAPPSYPAAYPQVIAVTAVGKDLRGYSHANHGEYIDVAAPGVGIWTALPNAMEGYQSGTSFAAPHVTAVLAAMYGRVSEKTKEAFLREMTFHDLGQPGRDRIYGRGLVVASGVCDAGHWVTEVVRAPAPPWPPAVSSGLTRSPRNVK